MNLMTKAKHLVLQDIRHQDRASNVREDDLTVLIFEKNRDLDLWTAFIETKVNGVGKQFYEVTYFLEEDLAHVTAYRAETTNPYKL